jgi:hypothetical protein
MGVVDLAVDPSGRPVALKRLILQGSVHEMARARQRIRREADVLTRLDHPGIIRLIELIDDGDEIVLVMPFLSGGTLAEHVSRRGPLAPGQVHLLSDTLLQGLASAHRAGVVHRDIKPANVLFDDHGAAQLADFGIASLRDATSGLTATGSVLGTVDFMAPEQARGDPVSPAGDVFSLGATLLFAATGRTPYGAADPRVVVHRAARGRVEPLPATLDPSLRRRLAPMLDRDPRRRPSAAGAAGGAAGTLPGSPRPPRPRRLLVGAAAAAVVAVGVVAASAATIASHRSGTEAAAESPLPPPTSACRDLPYQPCGEQPAANTDGVSCLDGFANYDRDRRTGCEAVPDDLDGAVFEQPISANLVPHDDVDEYPTPVVDNFQLLCNGTFRVTLQSPPGVSMSVELLDGRRRLGSAVSTNGSRATVEVGEPNCFSDDSTTLTTRVSWAGEERSAADYRLERAGSF